MTVDPLLVAELLALGAAVGFLAGLLGVGGGMLQVPFLTWMLSQRGAEPGTAVKLAIATSMATILFTSLSSLRAHARQGTVRWPLVRAIAPGLVVGGLVAGAGVFALLRGQVLALFFAVFIGWMATRMLVAKPPPSGRAMPAPAVQFGAGAGIGFVSGLVGAGGAFLSVPFMTRGGVPMHQAVGTSAALGFPIALANTAGVIVAGWHQPAALPGAWGWLYLPALVIVSAASVLLAPWGASVSQRMDVKRLKRLFALLLYGLAAYMLYRGLSP